MCKGFGVIEKFVEYLEKERKLTDFTDETICDEFRKYKGVKENVKRAMSDRAVLQMSKCILRKHQCIITLSNAKGRRFYSYRIVHSNARIQGIIQIKTVPIIK